MLLTFLVEFYVHSIRNRFFHKNYYCMLEIKLKITIIVFKFQNRLQKKNIYIERGKLRARLNCQSEN